MDDSERERIRIGSLPPSAHIRSMTGAAFPRRVRVWRYLSRICWAFAATGTCLIFAESSARLDDFVFEDIPFWHNPDPDQDLHMWDRGVIHGRPHGKYGKWQLDNFGFRGSDIKKLPDPGCTRIVALGSSETLGQYESPGMDYPTQLQRDLRSKGCYEVINAGIAGMTLSSMLPYWRLWVAQFKPKYAVLYPSPQFYLHVLEPKPAQPELDEVRKSVFRSRLVQRLHNVFVVPEIIQGWRDRRSIEQQLAGDDSLTRVVPEQRVALYGEHLAALLRALQADGVTPLLSTHPLRASLPPRPADLRDLESLRTHLPQVTPEVIIGFNRAVNEESIKIARASGVQVIDVASTLDGCRSCFGDLVHFSDEGATKAAGLIAKALLDATAAAPAD